MDIKKLEILLKSRDETDRLDFKKKNYIWEKGTIPPKNFEEKKSEFLKDILAFANTRKKEDAFIIIGVDHKLNSENRILGIDQIIDNSDLHDFINRKVNKSIEFNFNVTEYDGNEIGVIRIPSQFDSGPFFSTNNYGVVRSNIVYMKNGSSTREVPPSELILNSNSNDVIQYDVTILNSDEKIISSLKFSELFEIIGDLDYDEPERYRSNFVSEINPYPINEDYYRDMGEHLSFNRQAKMFKIKVGSESHLIKDLDIEVITNQEEINFKLDILELPSKSKLITNFISKSLLDKSSFSKGVYKDKIGDKKIGQFYESDLFYVLPKKRGVFDIIINTYAIGSPKRCTILKVFFEEDFNEIPISSLKETSS